jgi:hypothetical protein
MPCLGGEPDVLLTCAALPPQGEKKDSRELVKHKGTTLSLHGKDAARRPRPDHPLWRKRETLIQERIVEYTTVSE